MNRSTRSIKGSLSIVPFLVKTYKLEVSTNDSIHAVRKSDAPDDFRGRASFSGYVLSFARAFTTFQNPAGQTNA